MRIALGQRKGRLTVEFASVEDLNRILDAMHLRDDARGLDARLTSHPRPGTGAAPLSTAYARGA